ncbi:MAG TPA: long-chain fatty acid--CoA ligase [Bacteroidota bacterium]|nr:long-chain fatty acid--CoA ligase [Bacteroidota bacterium]
MPTAVQFTTIPEMFDRIVAKFHEDVRPVLRYKADGTYRSIRYAELRDGVNAFANGLASLGAKKGDTVGLVSENRPEWVITDMAMAKLGVVSVPVYPTLSARQTASIFDNARVRFIIVSNQFQTIKILKMWDDIPTLERLILFTEKGVERSENLLFFSDLLGMGEQFSKSNPEYLQRVCGGIRPEDILTIIYTSGTTGTPKGVVLTHGNLVSNIVSSAECIPFTHDDTLLSFLPLCHSYERMAGYYTAMACGATIAYAEGIETIHDNLLEIRPTVVTTVPRLFERMHSRLMKQVNTSPLVQRKILDWAVDVGKQASRARRNGSVPSLLAAQHFLAERLVFGKVKARMGGEMRFFVSGGASLSRELAEFFDAMGVRIIEGYGLTETSPVISVNRIHEYKFGTVGKPIPGVEVKLAPDGEILARGPNVMKGYWNDHAGTKEVIDADGWLHTGDIGAFDSEGFLSITDRKKHLFVSSGGKNIAPAPIENLFLQSKYIEQFVLIGDKRRFLAALIVPDFELLKQYAGAKAISFRSTDELVRKQEIHSLMEGEINRLQRDLAAFERVRKFTILSAPLTVENGEITPLQKIRRNTVEEKFRALIEKMYEEME